MYNRIACHIVASYPCPYFGGHSPEGGAKMAKTNEKYELMYIINSTLGEEEIAAVVEKFKALVAPTAAKASFPSVCPTMMASIKL